MTLFHLKIAYAFFKSGKSLLANEWVNNFSSIKKLAWLIRHNAIFALLSNCLIWFCWKSSDLKRDPFTLWNWLILFDCVPSHYSKAQFMSKNYYFSAKSKRIYTTEILYFGAKIQSFSLNRIYEHNWPF